MDGTTPQMQLDTSSQASSPGVEVLDRPRQPVITEALRNEIKRANAQLEQELAEVRPQVETSLEAINRPAATQVDTNLGGPHADYNDYNLRRELFPELYPTKPPRIVNEELARQYRDLSSLRPDGSTSARSNTTLVPITTSGPEAVVTPPATVPFEHAPVAVETPAAEHIRPPLEPLKISPAGVDVVPMEPIAGGPSLSTFGKAAGVARAGLAPEAAIAQVVIGQALGIGDANPANEALLVALQKLDYIPTAADVSRHHDARFNTFAAEGDRLREAIKADGRAGATSLSPQIADGIRQMEDNLAQFQKADPQGYSAFFAARGTAPAAQHLSLKNPGGVLGITWSGINGVELTHQGNKTQAVVIPVGADGLKHQYTVTINDPNGTVIPKMEADWNKLDEDGKRALLDSFVNQEGTVTPNSLGRLASIMQQAASAPVNTPALPTNSPSKIGGQTLQNPEQPIMPPTTNIQPNPLSTRAANNTPQAQGAPEVQLGSPNGAPPGGGDGGGGRNGGGGNGGRPPQDPAGRIGPIPPPQLNNVPLPGPQPGDMEMTVHFDTNKATVNDPNNLDKIVARIKIDAIQAARDGKLLQVNVDGYCDTQGHYTNGDLRNQVLGEERAVKVEHEVAEALKKNGVDPATVRFAHAGHSDNYNGLKVKTAADVAEQENRRAVVHDEEIDNPSTTTVGANKPAGQIKLGASKSAARPASPNGAWVVPAI